VTRFALACVAGAALALFADAAGSPSLARPRPDAGRSARGGESSPYAVVGVRSLRLREQVADLAADGEWVAVSYGGGCNVSFWHPRTRTWTPALRSPAVGNCFPEIWGSLAFAGNRAAWVGMGGGIQRWQQLITGSIKRPALHDDPLVSAGGCCAGPGPWVGTHLGDVVGQGKLLVFSTWREDCGSWPCSSPVTLTSQSIWRIVDGAGDCAGASNIAGSPHCVQIAEANGPLQPLAVDGGRIVVLRGDRSLELWDASGQTLRAFPFTSEPPLAAVLGGRSLSVLVQGRLDTYDTQTGALLHSWPLPDVPSGGRCRSVGEQCPAVRLELVAAAKGLVLYVVDRTVRLLRLSDGRDVAVARAAAADLTPAGLFYASAFGGIYPGRVRFIPYAELPLRAG